MKLRSKIKKINFVLESLQLGSDMPFAYSQSNASIARRLVCD